MSREYLVERIFPHTEIHLIGGPSGSGKTRWIFQTFIGEWQKGHPVLGHASYPRPWVYILGDRSRDDATETLTQLGYSLDDIRIHSAVDEGSIDLDKVIAKVGELNPKPELLIVEGLASLAASQCNNINSYKDVARFLTILTRLCKRNHITIIGVVHQPKMKDDSRYTNPRQRIMGSAAWAAYSATVVLIEPVGEGPIGAQERQLVVLPRNAPEMWLKLMFDRNGRLVDEATDLNRGMFDAYLSTVKGGDVFTHEGLNTVFDDVPQPTIAGWLADAIKRGIIERVGYGKYRKIKSL